MPGIGERGERVKAASVKRRLARLFNEPLCLYTARAQGRKEGKGETRHGRQSSLDYW